MFGCRVNFEACAKNVREKETTVFNFWTVMYSLKETIGFGVNVSFASRPVSRLIRWYNKPGDKTKEFW